ncbi:hypothetical protein [Paraburkholderia caledonica]|uniref:Uncharacterized protein n=1 Tax=Paraburkholderia caledonica TaxID=134536 RepID=A0AB73INT6_9BURK|nr:hypothetical protein [Paraburkholderia caledonica]
MSDELIKRLRERAPNAETGDDSCLMELASDALEAAKARIAELEAATKDAVPMAHICDSGLAILRQHSASASDVSVWSKEHAENGDTALYTHALSKDAIRREAQVGATDDEVADAFNSGFAAGEAKADRLLTEARNAALEEAAKVCDRNSERLLGGVTTAACSALQVTADAIRALSQKVGDQQ